MFAVGPVANARHVPIMGTSTTAVGITAIGDYVFRTSLPESDVIPVTLKWAMGHGVKSIALIYANDDAFSKSGFDVMKAAAQKAGWRSSTSRASAAATPISRPNSPRSSPLHPDAVGISALVEPTAGVLLAARQLGFGTRRRSSAANGANSPKLGEIAGAAADGLIVGSPWFIGKNTPVNQTFVDASARNTTATRTSSRPRPMTR